MTTRSPSDIAKVLKTSQFGAALSTEEINIIIAALSRMPSEDEVAKMLVDLEILYFMEVGAAREQRKNEYGQLRDFLIRLQPGVILDKPNP